MLTLCGQRRAYYLGTFEAEPQCALIQAGFINIDVFYYHSHWQLLYLRCHYYRYDHWGWCNNDSNLFRRIQIWIWKQQGCQSKDRLTVYPRTQLIPAKINNQLTSLDSHDVYANVQCDSVITLPIFSIFLTPGTPWHVHEMILKSGFCCLWHSVLTFTTAIACYIGQCYKANLLCLN